MTDYNSFDWSKLPPQLLNCPGRVVLVDDKEDCGIVLIEGRNPAFCLFLGNVVQGASPTTRLSQFLPVGAPIQTNAKKEDNTHLIPYLSTRLYKEGAEEGNSVDNSLLKPTNNQLKQIFFRLTDSLSHQIPEREKEKVIWQRGAFDDNSRDFSRQSGEFTHRDDRNNRFSDNNAFHNNYSNDRHSPRDYYGSRDQRDGSRGHEDWNRPPRGQEQEGSSRRVSPWERVSPEQSRSGSRNERHGDERHFSKESSRGSKSPSRYSEKSSRDDRRSQENRDHHHPKQSSSSRYRDHDREYSRNRDEHRRQDRGDHHRHHRDDRHRHERRDERRHDKYDDRRGGSHHSHSRETSREAVEQKNSRHDSNHRNKDRYNKDRYDDKKTDRYHDNKCAENTIHHEGRLPKLPPTNPKIDSDFYKIKEKNSDNPWRNMMQNLETNLVEDAPVNKEVVDENTAGNGGSRVASPADSPVYRASDDEADGNDGTENGISTKRPHTPLQDDKEVVSSPKHVPKRRKFSSPDRDNEGPAASGRLSKSIPLHTAWKPQPRNEIEPAHFKETVCSEDGHAVTVDSWNESNSTGVLICPHNGHKIVFHANHILEKLNYNQYSQVKEIYSAAEIKCRFGPGSKLRCFYRSYNCGGCQYQATAVWRDGLAPRGFRTQEYLEDLNKIAKSIREDRPVTSSLFSKVRDGVVHEYITYETGLIRLIDDDECVALFALDQVWASIPGAGRPNFLDKLDTKSVMSYLPVGSPVKVTVRPLPHSLYSQLCYQAVLVWKPELGSRLPDEYQKLTATKQARVDMSNSLDMIHDRIKQNLGMGPLSIREHTYPVIVPVCLNLLPKDATAHILAPETNGHRHKTGLVRININQSKFIIHALFHLEDVYTSVGKQLIQTNPDLNILDLKNAEVNLICRSIANRDSYTDIKTLADSIKPKEDDDKMSRIPLLQAVAVFVKSADEKLMTGAVPLPTFFRSDPSPINRSHPSAAFYFNAQLKTQLDIKVYEYIHSCDNLMNKRIKNLIHPRFLEKVEMQTVHNRVLNVIGNIDINRDIRHDYGYFTPTLIETVATCDLPQNLKDQTARIKVLWFDRPSPKYGLLKLDIEGVGSAYAFFSKRVINTKRYMSDICSLFWKNKKYVMVNVDLVDATSKIPYIVTEMWCIGDRNKDFSTPKDNLKDWNKVVPSMGCDHTSLNFRAYEEVVEKRFQESIKAEEHREEQRLKQRLEHVSKPKEIVQTTWKPAIKGVVCKVERVIGANYAAAFNHQLINHESKRYFVLFDLMDLYIDGKPSKDTAVGKTLKDFVTVGCKVRLNAVFCDVENSWNLNYIATGVVVGSNESVPPLPADAPCPDSVNKLMEAKIANFKLVASKITKKPPPPDTQPMPPPRENKISPSQSPSDNQFAPKPSNYKDNRLPYQNKYKDNRKGQNRNFDKPTSESRHNSHNVNEQNLAKRAEIIRQKPEVYKELQLMEINRDGVYIYDCKACGIQGMSIDDAEDHINSESHKESKLKRELMQSNKAASEGTSGSRAKQHFLDRSDAEEAIFINANQGISVEKTHTGLKLFICKACNSNKMSFSSAKKHVTSMAHKKRVTIDQSAIDHELTYMRKRIRSGVVYCCQPCGLQTESLLSTKEHVKDKTHIAKCEAYCHPCKLFFHDKKSLGDHKFSISHKKKIKNFEQELAKPFVKPVAKPASKPAEAVPLPAATPSAESEQNELSCEFCKFEAKDRREMKEHESTPSHQRRKFLKTKELPKEGIQAFVASGERCDSITELSYVREGKDIQEEADREKLLRTSQEIKDKQERLINKIFDSGIFIQQADKTKVKCITCSIMLTGKEKQLTRQLLLHFLGDKHKNKLIGEVKAEESTGVDRNESDRRREEERAAAEAEDNEPENDDEGTNAGPSDAPPAGQSQIQPEPVKQLQAPHESATDEEIILYLREQENVCIMMSDQLFSCLACYTGLKHLRQFYKHFMSEEHKKEITPTREWRQYVDLVDIFEHGEGLFKCLPCNTSPLSRQELETHLKTAQHMYSNVDEVKDYKITQLLPIELPVCQADASCNLCLASDLDLKIHERYKHKKVYDLTSDQIENLTTLSQSRNVDRQKMMNNVRGRILEILPDSNIGIIQLPQHENQYINVLFDLSAVVMPEKQSTLVESVRVGDPVLVNCVEMDLDPKNVGYSANINYYASCVTIGDEDEHSGMPRSYESLLLEKSDTITEACKLSLAALKVQLELCADGRPTPLFHTFPDKLENEVCFVVMKNQSCLLLKSLSTNCYAIQVLESMLITANSLETSSETFEVGQTVIVNGLLMNPALPTQYLVTGCWIMNERPAIAREQLALNAVVMYQSLVKSFCMEPEIFPLLDLSNVVVPEQFGTIGFDDIAADSTLTDDLADNSMSVDAPSQNNDDLADEGPIPFKRIKLGF